VCPVVNCCVRPADHNLGSCGLKVCSEEGAAFGKGISGILHLFVDSTYNAVIKKKLFNMRRVMNKTNISFLLFLAQLDPA
jgi:Na+-transporting NADH:ubiquinone oxidoreductase subunit NqrE